MKKNIFFTFLFVFVSFFAFSQDIIFRMDGTEIEVKVLQVADDCVKYKNFDHLDGPERILKTENIFMIKYENGVKELFHNCNNVAQQSSKDKTIVAIDPELIAQFESIGTDDHAMLDFFKNNGFKRYYDNFYSVCQQSSVGSTLLTSGILLTSIGLVVGSVGYSKEEYGLAICFYTIAVMGNSLIIASIPVSATAGARKERIKKNFARDYFGNDRYAYQPTLNFGVTSHGVGLTLKF